MPAIRACSICNPTKSDWSSYAIDLGTEVSVKPGNSASRITSVKAVKGIVYTHTIQRDERVYDISNRSTTDRTLLIEHPNRKGQGFAFVGEHKPKEEAADVFRFELAVPAKKDLSYTVTEERPIQSSVQLTNNADDQIRYFINLKEAPPMPEGQAGRSAEGEGSLGQGAAGHPDGEPARFRRSPWIRSACATICTRRRTRVRYSSAI